MCDELLQHHIANRIRTHPPRLIFHWLPAPVFDAFRLLRGRRPFLLRLQQRVDRSSDALLFFATREWIWTGSATQELREDFLSSRDREEFDFDISR